MDEFGNRLSDEAIKDLFREKPSYLNEDLCDLFKLKMTIFEKYLPADAPESELGIEEIDRKYRKYFFEFDEEEVERQKLQEYKSKVKPEKLKEIEERFDEKAVLEPTVFPTYTTNTSDEKQLIKLAKNFQRQYYYLYPKGPRHFLCLPNEYGTEKIVCTTLCPFLCSRHELRFVDDCAQFVADFLEYVPLESPKLPPAVLESPMYTLQKRKGNSLNFSTVLCSLLISANYDAYVVQGYGTRALCERDERGKPCPVHTVKTLAEKYEEHGKDSEKLDTETLNKYQLLSFEADIREKLSKYIKMMEDRELREEAVIRGEAEKAHRQNLKQIDIANDPFYGQRIHFWVLVKCGKREIHETVFIEPSTGEKRKIEDPQYTGIEFIWNNQNFWLNKQRSSENCGFMGFDFDDGEKWDYFLPSKDEHSSNLQQNIEWAPMPQTWVINRGYEITYEDIKRRLPNGSKETMYYCAKVQKFNPFVRPDGCIIKTTVYEDEQYEREKEIKEIFKHRNDRLIWRKTDVNEKEVTEFFEEGRDDGLKNHTYCSRDEGMKRIISFYPIIRPDGLIKRTASKEFLVEEFTGRKDFLTMRKITYFVEQKETQEETKISEDKEETELKEEMEVIENYLTPYSFEGTDVLLKGINFQKWKFEDFLAQIDPVYRYCSDSESDEDDLDVPDTELLTEELSEEEFETEYKLWLASHRDEIQELDENALLPVYEELSEDSTKLKARKKMLKKKIRDRNEQESIEGEKRTVKKRRRKLNQVGDVTIDSVDHGPFLQVLSREANISTEPEDMEEQLEKRQELRLTIAKRKQTYRMQKIEPGHKLIVDVCETYDRNPSIPFEKDVLRRRYMLDEGRYSLFFHPPPENITSRGIIFTKPVIKSWYHSETFDFTDDLWEEVQPGYVAKPFRKLYLYRELLNLMRSESEVIKAATIIDREILSFVEKRQREELDLKLVPSLSDPWMRKEIKTSRKNEFMQAVYQACKEEEKLDYLTPAFGVVGFEIPLDVNRAKAAYKYMISDFISGLWLKIKFIEGKLSHTLAEYQENKEEYENNDSKGISLEKLKIYEEVFKKIHTVSNALLMRCDWIEKNALENYRELKKEMFGDLRLKPFTEKFL